MPRAALGRRPLSEPTPTAVSLARAAQEAVRLWGSEAMLGWRGKFDFRQAMEDLKRVLEETA